MQIDPYSDERARLSRRLRTISDKEIKRQLKHYRVEMSSQKAVYRRGCAMTAIRLNGVYSTEPEDLMQLLHQFLDQQGVAGCRI